MTRSTRLRKNGALIQVLEVDVLREACTFASDEDEVIDLVTFVSKRGHDVHVEARARGFPYRAGERVQLNWNSQGLFRPAAVEDDMLESRRGGEILRCHGKTIEIRMDDAAGLDVRWLQKCCWLSTRTVRLADSSAYAFPSFPDGWVIVQREECDALYPSLVRPDATLRCCGLRRNHAAVPTVQFSRGHGGLDSLSFGDVAIVVEEARLERARSNAMQRREGGARHPSQSKHLRLTLRTRISSEQFSPKTLAYGHGLLSWTIGDSVLCVQVCSPRCQTPPLRIALSRSGVSRITSERPFISSSQTVIVGVAIAQSGGGEHRIIMCRVGQGCRAYALELLDGSFPAPVKFLQQGGEDIFDVRAFADSDDELILSGIPVQGVGDRPTFLGRAKGEDGRPGDLDLFAAGTRVQFEKGPWQVYAASPCAEGIALLRRRPDEDTAVYTLLRKNGGKGVSTPLEHLPLAICAMGDGSSVWIGGKGAGEIVVSEIAKGVRSRDPVLRIPHAFPRETVVEMRLAGDEWVLVLTPRCVYAMNEAEECMYLEYVTSVSMLGLCLSEKVQPPLHELQKFTSPCDDDREGVPIYGRTFRPIDMYDGFPVLFDAQHPTIDRDEQGRITSIDLGHEHDVLVNAETSQHLVVQHLACFYVVDRRDVRLRRGHKADTFVLRDRMGANMAMTNDIFGCLRQPELYGTVSDATNFHFDGCLLSQMVVVKPTCDGYAPDAVVCCLENVLQPIRQGIPLYYAYGAGFWER